MTNDIQFIYFDIGGVVVLDFSKTNKWEELATSMGIKQTDYQEFTELFKQFEPAMCVAQKTLDEFIRLANSKFKLNLPADYNLLDEFVNRFKPNLSLHPILDQLSAKYRLGLLTNMYPNMLNKIKARNLMPSTQWEIVVDSAEVKFGKPQPEIYQLAEERCNVDPINILFIENTPRNIEAASKRGWQTLLYNPANLTDSNKKIMTKLNITATFYT